MRPDTRSYRFGDFTLLAGDRQLLRAGVEVALRPKAFETLVCLLQHRGHPVPKQELLDEVWADTNVTEGVLTHCIAEIRSALDDDARRPRYVKTVSLAGYKFIAEVDGVTGPAGEGHLPSGAAGAAPTPVTTAVAVLPFANLSEDAINESFCDGLSEELINGLTQVRELRVVAHSSSFAFKGVNLDAREIGRRLNVGAILEGSVRKSGDRVRISAQLIDAASGYHLWSEQYDHRLDDIFRVQDDISLAILKKLELGVGPRPGGRVIRASTANMKAYLLYLEGRACWHRRFRGLMRKAMECFGRAIEEDDRFALAYTGLADCYGTLGIWGFEPPGRVFPRAGSLARQALALDDTLAEAQASRALINTFYDWSLGEAERGFARALDLNPGSALINLWAGHYFSIVGRFDEAIDAVLCAQALDPLSPIVSANVGWTLYLAGQNDRAIHELLRVLDLDRNNAVAHFYLGYPYAATGQHAEAVEAFRRALELTGGIAWAAESIGWVQGLEGNHRAARAVLKETRERMRQQYVPSSALALIHLGLGADDEMFEWLGRAVEERDALLPWLKSVPAFDRLHGDRRFQQVLARVGLADGR